jgi:hypothetical protein
MPSAKKTDEVVSTDILDEPTPVTEPEDDAEKPNIEPDQPSMTMIGRTETFEVSAPDGTRMRVTRSIDTGIQQVERL